MENEMNKLLEKEKEVADKQLEYWATMLHVADKQVTYWNHKINIEKMKEDKLKKA